MNPQRAVTTKLLEQWLASFESERTRKKALVVFVALDASPNGAEQNQTRQKMSSTNGSSRRARQHDSTCSTSSARASNISGTGTPRRGTRTCGTGFGAQLQGSDAEEGDILAASVPIQDDSDSQQLPDFAAAQDPTPRSDTGTPASDAEVPLTHAGAHHRTHAQTLLEVPEEEEGHRRDRRIRSLASAVLLPRSCSLPGGGGAAGDSVPKQEHRNSTSRKSSTTAGRGRVRDGEPRTGSSTTQDEDVEPPSERSSAGGLVGKLYRGNRSSMRLSSSQRTCTRLAKDESKPRNSGYSTISATPCSPSPPQRSKKRSSWRNEIGSFLRSIGYMQPNAFASDFSGGEFGRRARSRGGYDPVAPFRDGVPLPMPPFLCIRSFFFIFFGVAAISLSHHLMATWPDIGYLLQLSLATGCPICLANVLPKPAGPIALWMVTNGIVSVVGSGLLGMKGAAYFIVTVVGWMPVPLILFAHRNRVPGIAGASSTSTASQGAGDDEGERGDHKASSTSCGVRSSLHSDAARTDKPRASANSSDGDERREATLLKKEWRWSLVLSVVTMSLATVAISGSFIFAPKIAAQLLPPSLAALGSHVAKVWTVWALNSLCALLPESKPSGGSHQHDPEMVNHSGTRPFGFFIPGALAIPIVLFAIFSDMCTLAAYVTTEAGLIKHEAQYSRDPDGWTYVYRDYAFAVFMHVAWDIWSRLLSTQSLRSRIHDGGRLPRRFHAFWHCFYASKFSFASFTVILAAVVSLLRAALFTPGNFVYVYAKGGPPAELEPVRGREAPGGSYGIELPLRPVLVYIATQVVSDSIVFSLQRRLHKQKHDSPWHTYLRLIAPGGSLPWALPRSPADAKRLAEIAVAGRVLRDLKSQHSANRCSWAERLSFTSSCGASATAFDRDSSCSTVTVVPAPIAAPEWGRNDVDIDKNAMQTVGPTVVAAPTGHGLAPASGGSDNGNGSTPNIRGSENNQDQKLVQLLKVTALGPVKLDESAATEIATTSAAAYELDLHAQLADVISSASERRIPSLPPPKRRTPEDSAKELGYLVDLRPAVGDGSYCFCRAEAPQLLYSGLAFTLHDMGCVLFGAVTTHSLSLVLKTIAIENYL